MNIPPKVIEVVSWVPSGKGMAGLALQRGESIQTCNPKEDRSGAVKPGAKAVNAQAAIALPVRNPSGEIVAVVGAAFADEREIQGRLVTSHEGYFDSRSHRGKCGFGSVCRRTKTTPKLHRKSGCAGTHKSLALVLGSSASNHVTLSHYAQKTKSGPDSQVRRSPSY